MNVLIVHRYFWPDEGSAFSLMLKEVVDLHLARGDKVEIVAGATADFSADYRRAFGDRVPITTFRAEFDRRGGAARRIANSARLFALGARAALFGPRRDLVYLVSYPPLMAGLLGALARRLGGSRRVLFYVQDIFSYRLPKGPARRFYAWSLRRTIALSERVVTISDDMARELAAGFPDAQRAETLRKIAVIPNFSLQLDGPEPPFEEQVRDVVYAGNHGPAQNLDLFLEMLAAIPIGSRPTVAFFGDGVSKTALQSKAAALELGDAVTFHDPVPRERIAQEIARSRVGLVGARADLMRYAFPSKLADYCAAGTRVAVMCDPEGPTAAWLRREALGDALDPTDAAAGARQLQRLLERPTDAAEKSALRARARDLFGKAAYLRRLGALLDGMAGQPALRDPDQAAEPDQNLSQR